MGLENNDLSMIYYVTKMDELMYHTTLDWHHMDVMIFKSTGVWLFDS